MTHQPTASQDWSSSLQSFLKFMNENDQGHKSGVREIQFSSRAITYQQRVDSKHKMHKSIQNFHKYIFLIFRNICKIMGKRKYHTKIRSISRESSMNSNTATLKESETKFGKSFVQKNLVAFTKTWTSKCFPMWQSVSFKVLKSATRKHLGIRIIP